MPTERDAGLEDLLAKDAISDLLVTYCHATDRKDADLLESVFYPDAVLDFGYFHGGPKDLTAFSARFLEKFSGTHHCLSNVVIRVDGSKATSLSYITAIHSQWRRRSGTVDMIGYGRYVDDLEKRDDAWRIAHRKVMFDWTIELPSTFEWPESLLPFAGRRDRSDPSYRVISPA